MPNHCEFVLLETFQCYFPCCNIAGILKLTSCVSIKEGVQGTGDSYSTCLYSAFAKPEITIKAKNLSIKLKYKIFTVSFFSKKILQNNILTFMSNGNGKIYKILCRRIYVFFFKAYLLNIIIEYEAIRSILNNDQTYV